MRFWLPFLQKNVNLEASAFVRLLVEPPLFKGCGLWCASDCAFARKITLFGSDFVVVFFVFLCDVHNHRLMLKALLVVLVAASGSSVVSMAAPTDVTALRSPSGGEHSCRWTDE